MPRLKVSFHAGHFQMTANNPRAVAMLIAQLTFRGMPLVQSITLAQLIRLHEVQAVFHKSENFRLACNQ